MQTESESVTLAFHKPVPYMLEQANLFHAQLTADLADFTAVDSTVDAAYLTAFQTAITAAEDAEDPTMAKGTLIDMTANVNNLMEQARKSVQELYFFLGKAKPGMKGVLVRYGKENYEKARNSHPKMVDLMENATVLMPNDSADLIAAGYAQTKIDAFGTLFASLKTANQTQEFQKGSNLDITKEYYIKLNAVWAIMSQISELSKIVYVDDYVKRKIYLLYDPSTTGLSFSVTVPPAPAVVFHHVLEAMLPEQILKFRKISGIGQAWVCFAATDGGPCVQGKMPVNGTDEVEYTYAQISNGTGQYLRVNHDGVGDVRLNVLIPGL